MTNHWVDLKNADVVMMNGSNAAENHPAAMTWINKARDERGAKLMLGTDTITVYSVAGFAVHQELELAVKAGLTPYHALRYATVTPAEYLGLSKEAGTIEAGKRGDLLLLDANPLTEVQNTRRFAGVMIKGKYLPKPVLQRMLDEIAAKYATG